MFSLKRKGDYQLQLTRTVKTPGQHNVELYLFIPPDTEFSAKTLPEDQFFFGSVSHRFGLMGLQSNDRASKSDESYALLSPYFELTNGSWLFRYKASMGRLRQQMQSADNPTESITRALRLSQAFAQRLRDTVPQQGRQKRYFRQMDIYFSWFAEQFFLECMTLESYVTLDDEIKQSLTDFLQQEKSHRKAHDYVRDFQGTPTALWNRMSLYNRLLEYPASLRSKITELGAHTRNLVKAGSTLVIMLLLTYVLFNARHGSQTLSITLLFGIALMYAVRDMVREDMINVITRRLRKGKPQWRVRLQIPYIWKQVAQQLIWVDYRNLSGLSRRVADNAMQSAKSDDAQVICYRSLLNPDKAALEHDEIRETITLDFEAICEMIKVSRDRMFAYSNDEGTDDVIQTHSIERQQDYNLLLVTREPEEEDASAQLWRLRLERNGIAHYKSKDASWSRPESVKKHRWRKFLRPKKWR
ncbi:hypothetical protein [Marinimicrobium alkaliphilum]|uniref:hypothetical protein n=1 Tax=Marinimicrobium alkaliphilum TaxID=2202654 RepID=UPI000DBA197C|nr:hypothetical protein [Marinimicrobium alkaliphilum]